MIHALLAVLVQTAGQTVFVERPALPDGLAARFLAQTEDRPYLRNFLQLDAQMGDPAAPEWSEAERAAAQVVHRRLALDGILPTAARALHALGAQSVQPLELRARLAKTGLPVDVLERAAPAGTLAEIRSRLAAGEDLERLCTELSVRPLAWTPSIEGFELADESGTLPLERVRVQLTRGDDWQGEGDGGAVDLVRSLAAAVPDLDFVVHAKDEHVDALVQLLSALPQPRRERFLVFPQARTISQWAQDAVEYGFAPAHDGGGREGWLLAPRYASRGEEYGTLAPGDELATQTFHAAGAQLARSPLLFQGGNVLCARDPKTGARWLVLGEAELHRNMALGLPRDAALAALRSEFGCQRSIVLPATSFHIDMDLSLRSHDGQLVALVPDTGGASRAVLACAMEGLVSAGVMTAEEAASIRTDLEQGRNPEAITKLGDAMSKGALGPGTFPVAFAKHFERGPGDSGVGNLQRVMLALDLLVAEAVANPAEAGIDAATGVYLTILRKREVERIQVAQALSKEGFRVVGVPSVSAARRSLCTLNGLHTPDAYLMPAMGGFLAGFDQVAQTRFEAALPGVRVIPIRTGETQRRAGALHCAVLSMPNP